MGFERIRPNSGLLIGRKVYDHETHAYLGVLQLVTPEPNLREGGWWLTLKVPGKHEVEVIHRYWVAAETEDIHLPDPPPESTDDPRPVSPDMAGYYLSGPPESASRRWRGDLEGASWTVRAGAGDEDDETDPLIYPDEASAVATDDSVTNRPTAIVTDPDDPQEEHLIVPAGGDYGRRTDMTGDPLGFVKVVLAGAVSACTGQAVVTGETGRQLDRAAAKLSGDIDDMRSRMAVITQSIQVIDEHRASVITATSGHSVSAPSDGLSLIDQAKERLTEMHASMMLALQSLEQAHSAILGLSTPADSAATQLRGAADVFNRYRVSF